MEVHHLIVHELIKVPQESEARMFLSEACLPPEDKAQQLVYKLNQTFEAKSDTLLGYFSSPEDALFPGYFQLLAEANFSQEAFLAFSRDTMQALQLSLQGVTGAKGGYLVYAHYSDGMRNQLGIFLVRDTESIAFNKQAGRFDLQTITHLNTERLAMAGRIDLDTFSQGQSRCLELIKHGSSQRTISEYFTHWIGLDRPASSKALTQTFLELVDQLPPPIDESTGQPLDTHVFQEQVMAYAVSNPQKTISIRDLDKTFYPGESRAQKIVEEQALPLSDDFRFDQPTIKRHVQFRLSSGDIRLQFNRADYLSGAIRIEGDEVIISDPDLAERFRQELD